MIPFVLVRVVVILFLFWAAEAPGQAIFPGLRWLTCGAALIGVVQGLRFRQYGWVGTMAIIAFVFNPLLSLPLDRTVWPSLDYIAALLFLISIPTLRRH